MVDRPGFEPGTSAMPRQKMDSNGFTSLHLTLFRQIGGGGLLFGKMLILGRISKEVKVSLINHVSKL